MEPKKLNIKKLKKHWGDLSKIPVIQLVDESLFKLWGASERFIEYDSGIVWWNKEIGNLIISVDLLPAYGVETTDFTVSLGLNSKFIAEAYYDVKPWECDPNIEFSEPQKEESGLIQFANINFFTLQKSLGIEDCEHTYCCDGSNVSLQISRLMRHFEIAKTEYLDKLLNVNFLINELLSLIEANKHELETGLGSAEPLVYSALLALEDADIENALDILKNGGDSSSKYGVSKWGRSQEELEAIYQVNRCRVEKFIDYVSLSK